MNWKTGIEPRSSPARVRTATACAWGRPTSALSWPTPVRPTPWSGAGIAVHTGEDPFNITTDPNVHGKEIKTKSYYYGEEVGAYVVAEAWAALDSDAIMRHCRSRMTFEKSPKVVVFGTEIPVTSTGKYQRLKLQDLFANWQHTQFRPKG